jgi:hypothetical protein
MTMGRCPHCDTTVEAEFELIGERSTGNVMDARFQMTCPSCDAILGGAILSKIEDSGGIL